MYNLKAKLDNDEELKETYNDVLVQYKDDSIIERVTSAGVPGETHYLPHHAVVDKERETTKVRPVFDGSAKTKGNLSLNECLYSGPCLLPLIFAILLRLQMFPIALISDIKQAFLNIEIAEKFRDYTRFLWFDNVFSANPVVVAYRFTRVLFGLVCSPFLLNATIRHHLTHPGKYDSVFVDKFVRDIYVDDSSTGFEFD